MVGDVEFGLHLVEGNPSLTLVFFVALFLLAYIGIRFAFYAYRNKLHTDVPTQAPIWTHLFWVGMLAAVYGTFGLLEIVSSLAFPFKNGVILATTLALALSIRQIDFAAGVDVDDRRPELLLRATFVLAVLAVVVGLSVSGHTDALAAMEGLAGLAFAVYGWVYYRDQVTRSRLQGTMIDSLLRHLLPVLTFAALVSIVNLVVPLGIDRIVAMHVQVVFLIMTATALMTSTIKLRQNLAGL